MSSGQRFRLSDVATLKDGYAEPTSLAMLNGQPVVGFEVKPLGEMTDAVAQLPSMQQLPPGVHQVTQGDEEMMEELFIGFGIAMATGILAIYMVLVLLFKDWLQPLTILVALPLSLGGAFVALLVADKSFSLSSLIGLIMLMGIATKNSILLVEYAIEARRGHPGPDGQPSYAPMSRFDALVDAGHKRARPVVMTTLAMGAGMLPIALGMGEADPTFRSPMAVTVIGGLITSTILSLLVIPAVYTIVDDLAGLLRRLFRHRNGQTSSGIETAQL
ncbi:UNVERIFIED_ORG: multidrug efflux pump subunit AcrB [Comamonas terrigena]